MRKWLFKFLTGHDFAELMGVLMDTIALMKKFQKENEELKLTLRENRELLNKMRKVMESDGKILD